MAHLAYSYPTRVWNLGMRPRVSHLVQVIITTDTVVPAHLLYLLLCNKRACNFNTSTLYRDSMTSRFPTAAEIQSFPLPNYVDPATRRPLAIGLITPMTVVVIAFISCRFYSRTVLTKTLGWDDGIMLLAAVSLNNLLRSNRLLNE